MALKALVSILLFASLFSFSCASFASGPAKNVVDQQASAFWDSFNNDLAKGDLETYLKHWDENAERITPTVHARGIDEIRAVYRGYLEAYSDFHQQEVRRIIDGQTIVSELVTTATNRASGERMTLPNVAIVELNEDGKVIRARVYLDTRIFNP